jgi:peptidyl-prolyl cis-trans isomerase B (cyclophilin B)
MKHFLIRCAVVLSLGLMISCTAQDKQADAPNDDQETKKENRPGATNEVAVIKTTAGEMMIEFWPDVAPKTVANFKQLARTNFYDGTAFHRVLKGFMIQGGDPLTTNKMNEAKYGSGDPGYKIKSEFNERSHQKGVLSMARSNHPDTAGSQFFICHGDASQLDRQYTAFGKVIKGLDVLDKIANTRVVPNPYDVRRELSWPTVRVEVQSVKIVPADSIK